MSGGVVEIGGSSFLSATSNNRATVQNIASGTIRITGGTIISTQFSSIVNDGTFIISGSPTIKSTSGTVSTIQNSTTGNMKILGGNIQSSQHSCIVNNGPLEIENTTLESTANNKPAIQNNASGSFIITQSNVVSANNVGINNIGTMTIGKKDGIVNAGAPRIQGATYGVTSTTNFNFYDGIIKGVTNGINNESKISDKEENYRLLHGSELIDGDTYNTAYLSPISALQTVYQYDGDYVFDGTNTLNTGISLFSKDLCHKNFIISFTIKNYTLTGSNQPTLLNAKNEDSTTYEGFILRLKNTSSSMEASPKGCTIKKVKEFDNIANDMTIVIERRDNIIYITQNDELRYELNFSGFTKYFDLPLTIGSSYKNGSAFRFFTGTLSNIKIQLER